jgi:hypothetical protein
MPNKQEFIVLQRRKAFLTKQYKQHSNINPLTFRGRVKLNKLKYRKPYSHEFKCIESISPFNIMMNSHHLVDYKLPFIQG